MAEALLKKRKRRREEDWYRPVDPLEEDLEELKAVVFHFNISDFS